MKNFGYQYMAFHRKDSRRGKAVLILGKLLLTALLYTGLVRAELQEELHQQLKIEERLQAELDAQKKLSAQAYSEAIEFVGESLLNREEQLRRLKAVDNIWDEFIEKSCKAENLESIGTRAEHESYLQCMVRRYNEKRIFLKP